MAEVERYSFVERERCPACRSRIVETIFESRFDRGAVASFVRNYYGVEPGLLGGASYVLTRCASCTLVYQRWVGDDQLLTELYGEWIADSSDPDHDPVYKAVMAHPLESRDAHEIISAAAFLQKRPADLLTLDHGMGWAMWARVARTLGCRSHGTELSFTRAQFAREHGIDVLPTDAAPEGQFDFINTEQVMEHLPQVRPTVERLAGALRPGGILKISVPSADRVEKVIESLRSGRPEISYEQFIPVQPLEHVNSFTSRSLRELAGSLGLIVVRPSILQRYAFLGRRGTLSARRLRNSVKELARPFYTYRNPANLYVWFQKPW